MQGWKKFRKLVAFVPAIVLVGGFVSYRAGAFERFTRSEPQPEAQPAAVPQADPEADFMPGSKSMRVRIRPSSGATPTDPPPGAAPPSPAPTKPGTFIYSSKSGPIELPIPMLTPSGDGKPPAPNAPTPPP